MPRYDYHCDACGVTIEVRHRITESPAVACAECGAAMHRILPEEPAPVLNTDRLPLAAQHVARSKATADLRHAQRVADFVRKEAQPKTRASLGKALNNLPKHREKGDLE